MNVNKIWSILGQGRMYAGPSARKMDPALYSPNIDFIEVFDVLFGGLDNLETQFYIEQYVQLILKSIIRDKALEFDPINTYSRTELLYPSVGFVDNYVNTIYFFPGDNPTNYLHVASFDSTSLLFSVDGGATQAFTIDSNLTSFITLPNGDRIRIAGPISTSVEVATLQNTVALNVDWKKRFALLEGKRLPWEDSDLRDIYVNEINWVDRMAAVILQVTIASTK